MNMLFNSPGRSVRNEKNCAPVLSAAGSLWPRAVFKTPGRVFPIQITPLVNNIYIYMYIYIYIYIYMAISKQRLSTPGKLLL